MRISDWSSDVCSSDLARWSLTTRILAVNILAVALLAGGFYYLDTYRSRLVDTRIEVMKEQLAMLDSALEAARPDQRTTLIREFTKATEDRKSTRLNSSH